MRVDADEEALSWGDEGDPTHIEAAEERGSAGKDRDAASGSLGSVLLVLYGVFGGAYLLYAVGWGVLVAAGRPQLGGLFFEIMYQLGEFLAIASPLIWLGAVLLLTRGRRAALRLLLLLVGLLVVAPWPFILGGAQ